MASKLSRLLALALSLAAACGRAPVEPPTEPTPELPPPAASSTLIISSPAVSPPAYADKTFLETTETATPTPKPPPSLSKAERKRRRQQLQDMAKELRRVRRGIEKSRDKSVTLTGDTVGLIPGPETGRALTAEVESSTSSATKK